MPILAVLLRLLFPSWAFFDVAGAPPTLEVRAHPPGGAPGPWMAVVRAPARRWWHLVFNPEGTRALAEQTLVERWCDELEAGGMESARESVTGALVGQLAASAAPPGWRTGREAGWQYRLVVADTDRADADGADDVRFLSAVRDA
jgi:hypothetical protein